MSKCKLAFVVMAAGLAPAGLQAQGAFEGVVSLSMGGGKGGKPVEMIHMVKGGRSRQEMNADGQSIINIMDMPAKTMTILMPAQKMYMRMDLAKAGEAARSLPQGGGGRPSGTSAPGAPPRITATGKTEVVAGRTCEHYLMGDAQGYDICAAKGMGYFSMGGGGPMGGMGAGSAAAAALPPGWGDTVKAFADGFFPLKMEQVVGGKRDLIMQVNHIEAKTLADALFVPPPGYTEMKIPGLPFGRQN